MFDLFRSWIKPITYVSIVAFMGTIVLAWGMDIANSNKYGAPTAAAGVVNGEEVSRDEYNSVYQNTRNQQFGDANTDPTDADLQRLKEQVWANIVAQKALNQEMDRLGITASDEDVYTFLRLNPPEFMRSQPQFQTDGQFDYQRYLQTMADPVNAPMWAQVEEIVRPQVRTSKIQEMITSAARITQAEIKYSFLSSREIASFGFVGVPYTSFSDSLVEVSDAEVDDYYNSNSYRFKTDERRGLKLALFSKDITEEDWQRVKTEIQQIADMARDTTQDFAELARSFSEGPSAQDGGDIGYIDISNLDSLYVKGALALGIGETSDPVRSSFGWHVIKLLEMKDDKGEVTTDSDKAASIHTAHILSQVKSSDATVDNAERHARDFRSLAENKGMQAAADELGVDLKTIPPVRRSDPIQYLGTNYFATEWLFNADKGDYSGIYDNPSNFYVMELTEIKSAGKTPLSDVRTAIENLVKNEKLKAMSMDTARAIYAEIQSGAEIADAARAHNQKYVETTKFSRNAAFPPPIGSDPKGIGAAFSLANIDDLSGPVLLDRGAAIFKLLEKETPGLEEFNVASDSISASILTQKQNAVWQKWYTELILAAESENYIERQVAEQRSIVDTLFN
jgi:peptidyl-prolyl cis-trans isomerase D